MSLWSFIKNTGLFLCTLFFMTVYRFMSVYGLTWIINRFRKVPIPYNDQFIMSLSGLREGSTENVTVAYYKELRFIESKRGGIAFSLTKLVPPRLLPQIHQMLSACIAVILFTSFVQGFLFKNPFMEFHFYQFYRCGNRTTSGLA